MLSAITSMANSRPSATLAILPSSQPSRLNQIAAAAANRTETATTVFGPPTVSSSAHQRETTRRRAQQIEEIDFVDALDGREIASETMMPAPRNGNALVK